MLVDGVVNQGRDLGFVANVYGMEMGFAALVADCSGGLFAAVWLDVGEDYGGAFGGGLAGAGEAYALGGAGYNDNFVLEAVGHGDRKSTVDSLQLKAKPKDRKPQEFNTEGTESTEEHGEKLRREKITQRR